MAKRKSKQYTGQKEEQTKHWPKGRADNTLTKRKSTKETGHFLLANVLSALPFGQCIVCSFFWPVLCVLFLLFSVLCALSFGQCIVCSSFCSVYCLLFLLVSVLSALPFVQCIVCSSFWSVYCLLFLLASVLSALPFGQCIVCSSFWSVYCVLGPKGRADNTLTKRKSRQYTDQKEEQTIH
jgi:uncharacterized membrane protein